MAENIYSANDYKDFLKLKVEENLGVRGYKAKLAKAAGCATSFFSQVLHTHVHLTLDHALNLSRFWNLNSNDEEYFLNLLLKAKASSQELHQHLDSELRACRERAQDLSNRFRQHELSESDEHWVYYGSWYIPVIHMLITIPQFQRAQKIAEKLELPISVVQSSLKVLQQLGLAQVKDGKWNTTQKSIHLNKDSPASPINHSVWRMRAASLVFQKKNENMHYTALHSMSRRDFEKMRLIFIDALEKSRSLVQSSPEEEVVCVALDFFEI